MEGAGGEGLGEEVDSQREWGSLVGYGKGEMAWNVRNSNTPGDYTAIKNDKCKKQHLQGEKPTQNYIKADDNHKKSESYRSLTDTTVETTWLPSRGGQVNKLPGTDIPGGILQLIL